MPAPARPRDGYAVRTIQPISCCADLETMAEAHTEPQAATDRWTALSLQSQGMLIVVGSMVAMLVTFAGSAAAYWAVEGREWALLSWPPRPLVPVVVALAGGLACNAAGMVEFTRGIAERLSVVAANAERISHGNPLESVTPWSDEMTRLVASHERAAALIGSQEANLRAALVAAEAASAAKSDFLSRVSHELRTPLNAIIGFGQLLELEDNLTEEEREATDHILRAGRHLLGLIDELLQVARDEGSEAPVALQPLAAVDVLAEALALVAPLAEAREIALDGRRLEAEPGLAVLADRQRLLQVLLNLLSNAIKYNHDGGMVLADCRATDHHTVQIEVTDTGRGLDMADLDRLFTPFDRLGAEKTGIEGSGVGLPLSLSLVQAMHGTILVDSAVGVGSTFVVELPQAQLAGAAPAGGSST
jgi:signal transduction histidine kinase